MVTKLLKPLVVAALNGAVVLVTLPEEATVEFGPLLGDDLSDDHLTEVQCDGERYVARSRELLDAVQPTRLVKP